MNNLPAGAEHDSNAPWNQSDRILCTFCDKEEIEELWAAIEEKAIDDMADIHGDLTQAQCDQIQEREDEFRGGFSMCKNCGI